MLNSAMTCATCRFWSPNLEGHWAFPRDEPQICYHEQLEQFVTFEQFRPNGPSVTASDGMVVTRRNFGCLLYEPRQLLGIFEGL